MTKQTVLGGVLGPVFVNETGLQQESVLGIFVDETSGATATTVSCNLAMSTQAGLQSVVAVSTEINCTLASATQAGLAATITFDSTTNVNCVLASSISAGLSATISLTTSLRQNILSGIGFGLPVFVNQSAIRQWTTLGVFENETTGTSSVVTSVAVVQQGITTLGAATQQYTAIVSGAGSPSQLVSWGTSAGSISATGLFTAPAATSSPQSITITATSVQNPAISGTSTNTVPNAIFITLPVDGKIFPLSGGIAGTSSFLFSGTYSGTPPDQWQLVLDTDHSTAVAVTGGTGWQSFASAPSAGTFSQTIAGVPKILGWYNIQVRNSAITAAVYPSQKVGGGCAVVIDGQSQAWLWFNADARGGDSTLIPSPYLRLTGKQAVVVNTSWDVPVTNVNGYATYNNAAVSCGNSLIAAIGCPVGLIDGSWNSSGLTVVGGGGRWIASHAADNALTSSAAAVAAATSAPIANVFVQGEADAGAGTVTQSAYYVALGDMIGIRRTDVGNASLPYVIATLARNTTGTAVDADREAIKQAQVQKCADLGVYRVDRQHLPIGPDNVHHTPPGFTEMGLDVAEAIKASLGLVAQYRGPSMASVSYVSAGVFDVSLTNHSGTDFTPTSGITGFHVTDPGAGNAVIAVDTAVHQSASSIRLTLVSTPVSLPNISYLFGAQPVITGIVKDNSALTLPLEYSADVLATMDVTVSCSLAQIAMVGLLASITQSTAVNCQVAQTIMLGNTCTIETAGAEATFTLFSRRRRRI